MEKSFVIDSLPESALNYRTGWAVVAVDVIRATTMAITAVVTGRKCYPVDSLEAAFELAARLPDAILAGEIKGDMAAGLDMNNSPAELDKRSDIHRPMILLSSSGTRLIMNARGCDTLYLACFRNSLSMGCRLISEKHPRIALIGAGSRGQFREEDQICCVWIAALLSRAGYVPENASTVAVLNRWAGAKPADCLISQSVEYLRRTGQLADLRFILDRIDDLDETFILHNNEVVLVSPDVRLNRPLHHSATHAGVEYARPFQPLQ
jgi:2-phosphosulfolactate phosphatase